MLMGGLFVLRVSRDFHYLDSSPSKPEQRCGPPVKPTHRSYESYPRVCMHISAALPQSQKTDYSRAATVTHQMESLIQLQNCLLHRKICVHIPNRYSTNALVFAEDNLQTVDVGVAIVVW